MPPVDATETGVGVDACGSAGEETIVANGSIIGVLAGTTELGMPPVDAATRGATADDATEANGSTIGVLAGEVLAGMMELGSPPVDATTAGSGVGAEEATTIATDDTTEANGSTIGVLAGVLA